MGTHSLNSSPPDTDIKSLEKATLGMRKSLRRSTALIAAMTIMSLTACGSNSTDASKVRVGIYPNLVNNFDYAIADAKGFFTKNGLEVESTVINTGPDMVSALLSGSIDVGDQSTPTVLPVITKQKQPVSMMYGGLGLDFLMVTGPNIDAGTPNADLSAVKALKGKTIGVTAAGALTDWFARQLFREAGMDPDRDVTIITTGGTGSLVPALKAGKVDAAVVWNTDKYRIGSEGTDYSVVASVIDGTAGPNFGSSLQEFYGATPKWLDSHATQATQYCQSIKDGWDWAVQPENEAEVVKMLAGWVKLPESDATKLWAEAKDRWIRHVDEETWAAQGKFVPNETLPAWADEMYSPCQNILEG